MMISIVTCNISCSCLFCLGDNDRPPQTKRLKAKLAMISVVTCTQYFMLLFFFVGDGAWTPWGEWGDCSRSCAGGYRRRGRTCTNPTPNYFSTKEACEDNIPYDMERCNTQACTREFVKILIIWRGVILKPAHVSLFRF